MINLFQAFLLGLIEGLTEFLPVSSTAHLILGAEILKMDQTEFLKSFEIIIQFGAILAVVFLYWKSLLNGEILKRLAVAFIPTGVLGLIFYSLIKSLFIGNINLVLWSLLLGGILIVVFELSYRKKSERFSDLEKLPYRQCLYLGLFQSVAMVPGVSRSAATILGGLFLGMKRKAIVEFSFLLAVPTMMAATGLDLGLNLQNFSAGEWQFLAVGFITSFIMAVVSIKFLLSLIQKRTFLAFGVYRIIAAALFIFR